MPNEQKDLQPKQTTNQIGLGLAIGIAIGAPLGIALGIMLGAAIGASFSQRNKRD